MQHSALDSTLQCRRLDVVPVLSESTSNVSEDYLSTKNLPQEGGNQSSILPPGGRWRAGRKKGKKAGKVESSGVTPGERASSSHDPQCVGHGEEWVGAVLQGVCRLGCSAEIGGVPFDCDGGILQAFGRNASVLCGDDKCGGDSGRQRGYQGVRRSVSRPGRRGYLRPANCFGDAECLLGRLRERLDVEQHEPQPQGLQGLRIPPTGCRAKVGTTCAAKIGERKERHFEVCACDGELRNFPNGGDRPAGAAGQFTSLGGAFHGYYGSSGKRVHVHVAGEWEQFSNSSLENRPVDAGGCSTQVGKSREISKARRRGPGCARASAGLNSEPQFVGTMTIRGGG